MRGEDDMRDFIFSYISPEQRVPLDHPLRPVTAFADDILPSDDDSSNPSVDFRGEKRSDKTHASRTDPDSRLMRKGKKRR